MYWQHCCSIWCPPAAINNWPYNRTSPVSRLQKVVIIIWRHRLDRFNWQRRQTSVHSARVLQVQPLITSFASSPSEFGYFIVLFPVLPGWHWLYPLTDWLDYPFNICMYSYSVFGWALPATLIWAGAILAVVVWFWRATNRACHGWWWWWSDGDLRTRLCVAAIKLDLRDLAAILCHSFCLEYIFIFI